MRTPVVMIGYSRKETLAKSLRRLSLCEGVGERTLRIYLDAPYRDEDCKKCDEMYRTAADMRDSLLPRLEIIRRECNFGVPGNLLAAMRDNLDQFGQVIFFEDDVCVSRTFLTYMDAALSVYKNDARIFCVNGYRNPMLVMPRCHAHDIYLSPRNMAWGFGVWKDRWDKVDFQMSDWRVFSADSNNLRRLVAAGCDLPNLITAQLSGRVHTWDVQCTYHMVKNGLFAIEPCLSLSKNIGFGTEAFHCQSKNELISKQKYYNFNPNIEAGICVDTRIFCQFRYALSDPRLLSRVYRRLVRLWLCMTSAHDEPIDM